MSAVSLIVYKALYDIKTTCQKQESCHNCVYLDSCHKGGVPSPFPTSWDVDKMTSTVLDRAFKGR